MDSKKRVILYVDGSNFYHHLRDNYGVSFVDFYELAIQMIDSNNETITQINYFNAPVSQQESPESYVKQQRYFAFLRSNPLIKIHLGSLRKRQLKPIPISCNKCGQGDATSLQCPKCKQQINILDCFRFSEKGVDVKLAIMMLLDALDNKFDVAFLLSSDADFVPAINHVIKKLKKDVIYCHFPKPRTDALRNACTDSILISQDMIFAAKPMVIK